jgi:hypothetical protein
LTKNKQYIQNYPNKSRTKFKNIRHLIFFKKTHSLKHAHDSFAQDILIKMILRKYVIPVEGCIAQSV